MNTNTITRISTLAAAIGLAFSANGWAEGTATQTFNIEVEEIAVIAVTGNPSPLTISASTPGSAPDNAVDASTKYSITNNAGTDSKQITAEINANITETDLVLKVALAAPAGAVSAGAQTLSTSPVAVVTGIDSVSSGEHIITYTLSATAATPVLESTQKIVTFTITDS